MLRLRPGALLSVTDGRGQVAPAELAGEGVVAGEWQSVPRPAVVTLHPAVSKSAKLDFAVEKATELGVAIVSPVWCERSERRWDDAAVGKRLTRWQAIARAALEQSRGAWLPEVAAPIPLREVLARGVGTLLDLAGERADWGSPAGSVVAIGPEGGFSAGEVAAARDSGWRVAALGGRVLRTETACVVASTLAVAARGLLDPP